MSKFPHQDATTVELFAGAGGAALGLQRAGFRSLGHVEVDKHAVATLRAAMDRRLLDEAPVLQKRVENVDYTRQRGKVTVVWSSFPCPGYSPAGKGMGMADPRDGWGGTVRALHQLEPTWFIGENVDLADRHKKALDTIMRDLARLFPWTGTWRLDAQDFGVPQRRVRRFFVAGPRPVRPPTGGGGPSLGEALGYDPHQRLEPMFSGWRERELADLDPDYRAELLAGGIDQWWCVTCDEDAGVCQCPPPLTAETTLSSVSPTLIGGSQSSHTSARSLIGDAKQRLAFFGALGRHKGGFSVIEAAMIQGFPADWPFQGSTQSKLRQIANAVPPSLARAVAAAVLPTGGS